MNPRTPLLAACLALAALQSSAVQLMSAPVAPATPQQDATLVARLVALDARAGLTAEYSFRISSQHPGLVGQKIVRAQHTYRNLRVFGSESVVVTDSAGDILSVASADRRPASAPATCMPCGGEPRPMPERAVPPAPAPDTATPPAPATPAPATSPAPAAPSVPIPPPSSATPPAPATPSVPATPPTSAPRPAPATPPTPADLTPTLASDDAIRVAVQHVAPAASHRWPPRAELLIYPIMKTVRSVNAISKPDEQLNALDLEEVVDRYELAYLVKLRMAQDGKLIYYDVVVNAHNGDIITQWPALQTVIGSGNSQYNGVVPISTSATSGGFQMLDSARGTGGRHGAMAITNANHSSPNSPDPGNIYTNSSNTWGDGQQYNGGGTTTANGQTAAVNALWGLMNTYDTNKNVLGWQSLDGNNTATYIAAHIGTAYDNAFYDDSCQCMYIGDGNSFTSLGAVDVIGHEMSHGVTAATADLIYAGESGGLNESASDIGGEMVEAYARNGGAGPLIPGAGNDWMVGKEISKSGQPLRWMFKPSKDGSSPDAWNANLKNLDVHYSSGPNNRMYYFLSQGSKTDPAGEYHSPFLTRTPAAMTGIGNDKAYRIWFKALTTKFTSATNYADARNKVLQSAQELYGATSKEAIAVQRAYAAINVGADIDEESGGGGGGGGGDAVERISNGGFENGVTGWRGNTSVIGARSGQTPYEGTRFAWVGGNGRRSSATLTQQVQIPANASSVQLSFALHIDTAEISNTVYDTLTVTLRASGSTAPVLATLATYTNLTPAAGYQLHNFDLLPFKGQTVTLSFAMREDRSRQTSFVLDQVSLLTK